jgi:hypothetical protein
MSRTVRRKNADKSFKKLFTFDQRDVDENGVIGKYNRSKYIGLTLEEANIKAKALFHSCKGPTMNWTAGKGYRQEYRAKSKQQLREQLIVSDTFEDIQIDKLCNDWRYWD